MRRYATAIWHSRATSLTVDPICVKAVPADPPHLIDEYPASNPYSRHMRKAIRIRLAPEQLIEGDSTVAEVAIVA